MLMMNGSNQEPFHEAQGHRDWETGRELRITHPSYSQMWETGWSLQYLKGEHKRLYQKNYTPKIHRQYKGEDFSYKQHLLNIIKYIKKWNIREANKESSKAEIVVIRRDTQRI